MKEHFIFLKIKKIIIMYNYEVATEKKIKIFQECINKSCNTRIKLNEMIFKCKKCGSPLEYNLEGSYDGLPGQRNDLWKNFDLMPLEREENIISLDAGGSEIIHLEELSKVLNGANLFLMCDHIKNPTGTFKDREASIILSRCKELGLDNLVFYSTANTGRAYTHYAAHLGLTTYMFMPNQCQYKNTDFIKKNKNNFIIYVNDHYPEISPFAKTFASMNNLTPIAPMHDRTESYATLAYEQFQKMPDCDYFVQTIASGMGPIGFYKGHQNLVKLGIQKNEKIPKIVCIQSSEINVMSKAYNAGRKTLTENDLSKEFPDDLFEPTLNSTNPINNYPQLLKALDENKGIITDVDPESTMKDGALISQVLEKRGMPISVDLEKSILIEFAGVVKLARQGVFKKGQTILMLGCGRGKDYSRCLLAPDAIINVKEQDPIQLYSQLQEKFN
jgi:threonine synthase